MQRTYRFGRDGAAASCEFCRCTNPFLGTATGPPVLCMDVAHRLHSFPRTAPQLVAPLLIFIIPAVACNVVDDKQHSFPGPRPLLVAPLHVINSLDIQSMAATFTSSLESHVASHILTPSPHHQTPPPALSTLQHSAVMSPGRLTSTPYQVTGP